ncbi:ATP-binding protein [Alteromonas sp. 5E99-2]|uniref:ATP-binding protein n=1 Tax=Alteromonas sp. 5E99-2 TaxID=2817683 RepID=UPI001A995983|nr:ATP-binding protein [Alteromonas sp. 5E99-2]MBO1255464.1 ATP-binding protein [Alteromonas sp. 5E99-2]
MDKTSFNKIPYVITPLSNSTKSNEFLGRVRFREKLKATITQTLNSKDSRGACYLVGGYRGVGKTRLIDTVLDDLLKNPGESKVKGLNKIKIDLGVDSNLSSRDILHDIAESIYSISLKKIKFVQYFFLILLTAFIISYLFITNGKIISLPQIDLKTTVITPLFLSMSFISYRILRFCFVPYFTEIHELLCDIRYTQVWEHSTRVAKPSVSSGFFNAMSRKTQEPISTRRIQLRLQDYLKKVRESRLHKKKFIIVFDEVDKINPRTPSSSTSNNKSKKQKVDELLGELKAFLTNSSCVMIVVAGREIVDAFYSESGYTSVLYESVFDDIFYIPTLLTDWSDGNSKDYSSMVKQYVNQYVTGDKDIPVSKKIYEAFKENSGSAKKIDENNFLNHVFYHEMFIKYLTLHSWGNFKRLELMLKDHTETYSEHIKERVESIQSEDLFIPNELDCDKKQRVLLFTPSDIHRMFVSARLYSLFEVHQGRVTSKTDDKAAVSSFITILDLFRFHSRGFSRPMIDRTVAGVDIHAETTLSYLADDYLHSTFSSMIRRTSNNLFPYRFFLSTDMEFSYLAKLLGAKSSSFEFALDSSEPVREYYKQEAMRHRPDGSINSFLAQAKTQYILGDIATAEHNYDEASSSYSNTVFLLKKVLRLEDESDWRHAGGISLEAQYLLIRTLLKKGTLEEARENTRKAIAIYKEAEKFSLLLFEQPLSDGSDIYQTKNVVIAQISEFSPNYEDNYNCAYEAILSKLANDFVEIKAGRLEVLEPYEKYAVLKTIGQETPQLGNAFFEKYLSAAFYSGHYRTLVSEYSESSQDYFSQLLTPMLNKTLSNNITHNEANSLYLWGHAQFSSIADEIKSRLQNTIKQDRDIELFKLWSNLVCSVTLWEGKINGNQFHSSFENWTDDNNKALCSRLLCSFEYIFMAADANKKQGRYADAAHQYCSILLNWIAILEILPWKKMKALNTSKYSDLERNLRLICQSFKQKSTWLEDVIESAQICVEKSDKSANILFRQNVVSASKEHLKDDGFHKNTLKIKDILNTLNTNNDNAKGQSVVVWCRSNISNYLLMFGIWEHYCRYSFSQWYFDNLKPTRSSLKCELSNIPAPIGNLPRVHALYLWLNARYAMHSINRNISDKIKNRKEFHCLVKSAISVIEWSVEALDEFRRAFRSEDPDSFPPKTLILFNLYELLELLNKNEYLGNNLLDNVRTKLRKKDGEITRLKDPLYAMHTDMNYVEAHLNKNAYDLVEIDNVKSMAFRRKLRHKYFLYDDFEDPFYIAEFSYLRMLSSTSKLLTISSE